MLAGKKIVLGVTGSIAAYKSAFLVRLLVKAGATIKVVVTPASLDFITPLTLATLSKNPVIGDFVGNKEEGTWNNHVELGLWADMILVAPASANTISKMASGQVDNFLLAVYLSAKCPVYIAPAMDLDMYAHESTWNNLRILQQRGNFIVPAEEGELASGLEGKGRMAEPEHIVSFIENDLLQKAPLRNKKVLVTAGPTYEAIDPVRFIGNRSTGKMGYAIAHAFAKAGAEVVLVSGPSGLPTPAGNISRINVESASEMFESSNKHFESSDIIVMSAAVSDYKPEKVSDQKIKKSSDNLVIHLAPTTDIAQTFGSRKSSHQILVGFALETNNELENARQKLIKKNFDFIVLNSLRDEGSGFGTDTNKITLLDQQNNVEHFELKPKEEVAEDLVRKIIEHYSEKS